MSSRNAFSPNPPPFRAIHRIERRYLHYFYLFQDGTIEYEVSKQRATPNTKVRNLASSSHHQPNPRGAPNHNKKTQVKLTGELSTNALSPGEDASNPDNGILVDPGVNAQHHQHMFCARIDVAVDDEEVRCSRLLPRWK